MDASFLATEFSAALSYADYLRTGTEEQQRRWQQAYDVARLSEAQQDLVAGFVRSMNVLVVSGIWCGDCVQQCPLMQRIAEANAA
ncbi:MAG TPA: thioredoxin family protein, partial [Tepidisphaeraceae bacterium]|nr:thioredoxin family protein [Tepidisphaeraceae bacterium]